jgi:hypothetical protein
VGGVGDHLPDGVAGSAAHGFEQHVRQIELAVARNACLTPSVTASIMSSRSSFIGRLMQFSLFYAPFLLGRN